MEELYRKYKEWIRDHEQEIDVTAVTEYVEALQDVADGIERSQS